MNNCKNMGKKCEYADRLGLCGNLTATCTREAHENYEKHIAELEQIADHYEQTAKDYWKEACEYKQRIAELEEQLPKRGEWLNVTDSYSWYGKCSVCGEEFVVDAYYAGGMNYCPNCGAKMDGEVKEDE